VSTQKANPLQHQLQAGAFLDQDSFQKLESDELQVLRECLPFVLRVCNKKFSRNAVSKLLAYVSFENKEFSQSVMKELLQKIQNCDFDQLVHFKKPLVQMGTLEDENA